MKKEQNLSTFLSLFLKTLTSRANLTTKMNFLALFLAKEPTMIKNFYLSRNKFTFYCIKIARIKTFTTSNIKKNMIGDHNQKLKLELKKRKKGNYYYFIFLSNLRNKNIA